MFNPVEINSVTLSKIIRNNHKSLDFQLSVTGDYDGQTFQTSRTFQTITWGLVDFYRISESQLLQLNAMLNISQPSDFIAFAHIKKDTIILPRIFPTELYHHLYSDYHNQIPMYLRD